MKFRVLLFSLALALSVPIYAEAITPDCGTCRLEYTGNGSSTTYAYNFKVTNKAYVRVWISGVLQTVDSNYTVTGVNVDAGGSIVFTSPPASQAAVVIERNQPFSQTTTYSQGGAISGPRLETDFDALVMQTQQLRQQQLRTLGFADSTVIASLATAKVVPSPVAGFCLAWNSNATALENVTCGGGGGTGSGNALTLQSRNLASTAPTDGQNICWDGGASTWKPCTGVPGGVYMNQGNAYSAGATQVFLHSATTSGLRFGPAAGDPSGATDGDIWYNSSTGKFRKREGGSTSNLDTTGGTPSFADLTAGTNPNALVISGTLAVSGGGTIAATTAAALAATPSLCATGEAAKGITANGTGTGCTAVFPQRTMTAADTGITITNGSGAAGNPTFSLGPLAVKTNASNTFSTGDQSFAAASSFTFPIATGATPTLSGRCAYDSTSNRMKCGFNGSTVTLAITSEIQPLNANLTAFSGLTGVNNTVPIFTAAGTLTTAALPTCIDSAGQHLNYDTTTRTWSCGTSSTGGLSGLTTNKFLMATAGTTADTSGNLSQAAGVVNASGGFTVGDVGTDSLDFIPTAYIGHGHTSITWPYVGGAAAIALTTGSLTTGHSLVVGANGQITDSGGTAGTGTWTDSSTNTGTNKTLVATDAGGTNTITTGVKAYFDAASLTPDGTNCTDATKTTINSGPVTYVMVCADSNSSTFDGHFTLPSAVATLDFRITVNDVDSSAQHFAGGFKAMCRASGAAVNATWGTSAPVDITMTTADNDYAQSVNVTPNGTCGANAELFWRFTVDATNHTDNPANARILGVLIKQAS